jgi:hypothetical protein
LANKEAGNVHMISEISSSIVLGAVIVTVFAIAYVICSKLRKNASSPSLDQSAFLNQNGIYSGVERRAYKRTVGALFRLPNGKWFFKS